MAELLSHLCLSQHLLCDFLSLGSGLQFPQLSPARLSVFSSVLFSPAPRPGLLPQPAS